MKCNYRFIQNCFDCDILQCDVYSVNKRHMYKLDWKVICCEVTNPSQFILHYIIKFFVLCIIYMPELK